MSKSNSPRQHTYVWLHTYWEMQLIFQDYRPYSIEDGELVGGKGAVISTPRTAWGEIQIHLDEEVPAIFRKFWKGDRHAITKSKGQKGI